MYYNRFRYYASEEGIYISQDPIGLGGGNPTFYAYVHDPNRFIDVFGLTLRDELINSGQGITGTDWQAHHVIPNQSWDDNQPFLNQVDFTGRHEASNGVALPNSEAGGLSLGYDYYHNGSHGNYTDNVNNQISAIQQNYNDNIQNGMSHDDAARAARNELSDLQDSE